MPRTGLRPCPTHRPRCSTPAVLACLALFAPGAQRPARADAVETVPVTRVEGVPHLPASELARLLDAAKFWRADVRKLVLRTGGHQLVLTVDNPFVVADDRTLRLASPVLSVRGEILVPVELLASLPRDSTLARLLYDSRRGRVVVLPAGGTVGTPRITIGEAATRITFRPTGARTPTSPTAPASTSACASRAFSPDCSPTRFRRMA